MSKEIKVLVVPDDNGGVAFHRMLRPHQMLHELFGDEFDIEINMSPDWGDKEYFKKFDILNFHKGVFDDMENFWERIKEVRERRGKVVMDIDDFWDVGQSHMLYHINKYSESEKKTLENLRLVDYVTTTTDIFAKEIKKYNPNVVVFPNAINPEEEQVKFNRKPSDRIRFGLVMGSSHQKDVQLLSGLMGQLGNGILDKIQIVLCGFDLDGTFLFYDENHNVVGERPMEVKDIAWVEYEREITDNYKTLSPEYAQFLKKYLPQLQYPQVENTCYRREWTKNVNTYLTHYDNIDILLVPLKNDRFNSFKSELKFAEAGFKHCGVVCSNCGPYTIGSKSIFQKGGVLDKTGNCVLIDEPSRSKDWAKAIKRIVNNPELVPLLQENMYNHVLENYDLRKVTEKRAAFYREIAAKQKTL